VRQELHDFRRRYSTDGQVEHETELHLRRAG
jgi:hypothetical protein